MALSPGIISAGGLPAWGAEAVAIWAGPPQEHAVALTFDDGPSPIWTPRILEVLERAPYEGVEHPSQRGYIWAIKP